MPFEKFANIWFVRVADTHALSSRRTTFPKIARHFARIVTRILDGVTKSASGTSFAFEVPVAEQGDEYSKGIVTVLDSNESPLDSSKS